MATTKSGAKASPGKRPAPTPSVTPVKSKPVAQAQLAVKAKPAAKAEAAPKVIPKVIPKAAPKATAAKPVRASAKKADGVPAEQRKHYVEMAAYYIAERRRFAPGNPLEDWVQAEVEIDRLLAEGRLGG